MRLVWLTRAAVVAGAAMAIGAAAAQDMFHPSGKWLDDRGQPYRLDALYDAPTVISMAYGACRRVCSTSLRIMEQVQRLADARHLQLNFVVVGLDPGADRPEDWAELRAERHLERPNWHFLSGDEASIRQLARRLGVRYWRYGEHTLHDLRIVLLSAQAQPLKSIDSFDQAAESLLP
jgi:protein SCO1/2